MKKSVPSGSENKKKSTPFSHKLFFLMIILALLQMGTFFGVLFASGELTLIKRYAYNMFTEKTENRKNYVESMLTGKMGPVYETSTDISRRVDELLEEKGMSAADISADKELNREIISLSVERLIDLLRQDSVNDVFIILDAGTMYDTPESDKNTGFYIRDLDTEFNESADRQDLLVEVGNSEMAAEMELSLDADWAAHFEMNEDNGTDFSFYTTAVETARENPGISLRNLGCWSGFSKIAYSAQESIKYTMPLISSDGTVYGAVGIGIMKKTILSTIPSNDFFNESACYILGADFNNEGEYSVLTSSGAIYSRLVNEDTVINEDVKIEPGIYDFNKNSDVDTIGCIVPMKLYNSGSPYNNQQWALISVGDKDRILNIYSTIVNMLLLSTVISVVFSIVFAVFLNRKITSPVTQIIETLNERKDNGEIISFESSGITEIDKLADSITELQISVKKQASKVSKIISMADMGIGVFMYDLRNGTVFVGESLMKLLDLEDVPCEDTVISFEKFKEYISVIDANGSVFENEIFSDGENTLDKRPVIETVNMEESRWFRFKLMRSKHSITGLVQDATNSVIEKRKIEYERDYDVITGLLNRRAYYNKVDEIFRKPKRLKTAAFIMWDLDNLKYVNDTYGHDLGDDYIKTTANVFKHFRDYGGLISRLSGDEFNVFLYGFDSKDEIRNIVETVRGEMNESYCSLADGTHFKLRASGGIAWYPDDSRSYEQLIKYSDFAMFTIKHSTKGRIADFDISSYKKDSILMTGVEEMNRIIEEESVKYAFHTIVSAKTGEVYGYEALMRPQSDILKTPLEFIRLAKTSAKMYEIERLTWILGLRSFRNLMDEGIVGENEKVFINSISDCIIKQEDIELIENENKDILDRIVLEILENEEANEEYMTAKRGMVERWHAKTALDDFGCGYNSEFALITLNPDLIKIDRSIISGCDKDISRRNIISNLVQHSKMLGIMVLAEGVETYNEMKTVIKCGVDLIQGYYINRPLFEPQPVDPGIKNEILELYQKYNKATVASH